MSARSRGTSRRRARRGPRRVIDRLAGGAAGSKPSSSGARGAMVAPPRDATPRRRATRSATSAGSTNSSYAVWATRVAASSVVSSACGPTAASRKRIEWPGVPSGAIERSGWIVGQTQLTLAMSVLPAFGSSPWSAMPYAADVARNRIGHRARVVASSSSRRPRTSPRRSCRSRAPRPRTARRKRVLHRLVVRLVVAAEHEPGAASGPG